VLGIRGRNNCSDKMSWNPPLFVNFKCTILWNPNRWFSLLLIFLDIAEMSRAQSSSSCSHNSWLIRNQSLSCNSGGCRGLGEAPTCNCRVEAVLRTARTVKNGGRQFWGCPNFKVRLLFFFFLFR